jgi:hypothetical protein
MKTATGLTAIAVGAVLAFAVNGHPWFLNLQVVGWIIMLLGAAGLVMPRRGYGWLRRRVVVTRPGAMGRRPVSRVMIDPATSEGAGFARVPSQADVPPDDTAEMVTEVPVDEVPVREVPVREVPVREVPVEQVPVRTVPVSEAVVPGEEIVEEYYPE